MTNPRSSSLKIGCLMLLVTLGTFIAGLVYGLYTWSWVSRSQSTTGLVIDITSDSEGGEAPVVEYHVNDQTYRYESSNYRTSSLYAVGSQVSIVYDPGQPGRAKIESFSDIWFVPFFMTAASVIMAFFEIPFLLFNWFRR